jgi:putative FmdB family regulatory protein
MPTYDYECNACGHTLEALQSMTEPKLTRCPHCGKDALARLIGSGSGVIFKGSGFYETDYKKKDSPREAAPSACASCPAKDAGGCAAQGVKSPLGK